MIKIIALIGLVLSASAFAKTIMVLDDQRVECQKIVRTEYKCHLKNEEILVKDTGFGFTAVLFQNNQFPKVSEVSEVIEDNKTIFVSHSSGPLKLFSNDSELNQVDSISNRISDAKGIISNWSTSSDKQAQELVLKMTDFVENQSKMRNHLKLVSDDGGKYECTRGEDLSSTKHCSLFTCVNNKNEKALGVIPEVGSLGGIYAFIPNAFNPKVENNGIKIFDLDSKDDVPLFNYPKLPELKFEAFTKDQKALEGIAPMPKSFRGNQQSFKFFSDEFFSANFDLEIQSCKLNEEQKNLIKDKNYLQDKIKEDISKIDLTYFLTYLNGKILSVALDSEKVDTIGCRYNGMLLSDSMNDHLSFLEKIKPKPVQKFISEKEVQDLYRKAKAMKDIPFDYKDDGCYARAHLMARRFEKMGIPVEKAWIKGNLSVPGTDIQWNYHVAPVINVKDDHGEIVKYVIDPSLNDKAVPLDTWVNSMKHDVKGNVVKTPFPFPSNIANFQRTAVAISSSDVYVPDNDELRSEAENMKLALSTLADYSKVLQAERMKK